LTPNSWSGCRAEELELPQPPGDSVPTGAVLVRQKNQRGALSAPIEDFEGDVRRDRKQRDMMAGSVSPHAALWTGGRGAHDQR